MCIQIIVYDKSLRIYCEKLNKKQEGKDTVSLFFIQNDTPFPKLSLCIPDWRDPSQFSFLDYEYEP